MEINFGTGILILSLALLAFGVMFWGMFKNSERIVGTAFVILLLICSIGMSTTVKLSP